jgi:hypothetical protein
MESSNFRTQRLFSNFFEIEHTEPSSGHTYLELVLMEDYDKKVTYLLKRIPEPNLAKIILDKFKFNHYQEKVFLEKLQETIEGDFEEHELECLVRELNNFTKNSKYIECFQGQFYGDFASVHYRLKNSRIYSLIKTLNILPDNTSENSEEF